MSKAIPILGIVSIFLAVLSVITSGGILVFLALFPFGVGIYLAISKDWKRIVPGASAILFSILAVLGGLGNISTDGGGGADFGISAALGSAFLFVAFLEIAGASIILNWEDADPAWLNYTAAGLWLIAFVLALVFQGSFGTVTGASLGPMIPAFLMLAGPVLYLREL